MTTVACFCGTEFSFAGDAGVCPTCGEYTTLHWVSAGEAEQMHHELNALLLDHADDPGGEPETHGSNSARSLSNRTSACGDAPRPSRSPFEQSRGTHDLRRRDNRGRAL
jgi:hypothetical protein